MARGDVAFCLALSLGWLACGDDAASTSTANTNTSSSGAGASTGGTGSGAGGSGGQGGSDVPMNHYLYVANGSSNEISRFSLDEGTGELTDLGATPAGGGPGSMALSPDHRRLYVALRNDQSVIAYDVDAASGALTEIATTDVGINPVYLRVDATNAFLLMSSYSQNTVRVHAIAGDGSVVAGAVDTKSTGINPHSIMLDPSNEWAFVPLTNNDPDVVLQYDFDPATGALTANGQSPAATNSGPRHSIFHPSAPYYYVVNEHDDTVALYSFEAASGTVGATMGYSTLPSGFDGDNNTCADIHITPDGLYLYASNRGHDSLAMFAVSASDGTLSSLGQAPTEATPREFEIALGRYVYAAGQSSGMLAAYAIEPASGVLTPIATYPVGGGPEWVTAASLPR